MKTMIAHLRLSEYLGDSTRDRCPSVVFATGDRTIAAIRTDAENLCLPLNDGEIDALELRDDALGRVIDEAAWLREFFRVLSPGGEFRFTLSSAGMLAWLDPINIYRYAVDIGKRGEAPDAALPTGWNRHYGHEDVAEFLNDAGFDDLKIQGTNSVLDEIGMFASLFWGNWIRGDRSAEHRAFSRFGKRQATRETSIIGTTWSISARRRP